MLVSTLAAAYACGGGGDSPSATPSAAPETATASPEPALESTSTPGAAAGTVEREIEEVIIRQTQVASGDSGFYLDHLTDRVLRDFYYTTRSACAARTDLCIGEPTDETVVSNIRVDGDSAAADVSLVSDGFEQTITLFLVRENGVWKVDAFTSTPAPIPEGEAVVDLATGDFQYAFDGDAVKTGDFAFRIRNDGGHIHEVFLMALSEGGSAEEAAQRGSAAAGSTSIARQGPFVPGQSGTMVFDEPLAPGRYFIGCFLRDPAAPNGPWFAAGEGMYAEFSVE